MKKFCAACFALSLLLSHALGWANTLDLFNDSPYVLRAMVYDASGALLSEGTLNPGNTLQWSDSSGDFNEGKNPSTSQTPYTVSWYCMQGGSFGTCTDIAPGTHVTAQSCSGNQDCEPAEDGEGSSES